MAGRVKRLVGPREFIVLMAAMMSIVAISIDAMLPALGLIARDFSVANPNHVQYIISSIFVGSALGQLVCGPLSDAFGRKPILYGGIVLFLIGSVVAMLAPTLPMMLVGRVIQGLGVAAPYVSVMSVVRDRYAGAAMARVMSLVMMIFILVPTIAPALGQAILAVAPWRAIFAFYIVYAVVMGSWIGLRLEETLPKSKRTPFRPHNIVRSAKLVIGNRAAMLYVLAMGSLFGCLIGYISASQQIFQDQFGTGEMFVVYFGCLALTFGAASFLNSKLVERFGMRMLALRAMGVMVANSVLFLALHGFVAIELWMFLGYAAILFFAFGLVFGNLNALAMEPMGAHAGMAAAVIGAFSSFLSIFMGAYIGQLYNGTLVPIAGGFAVLGLVALVAASAAGRIVEQKQA